MYYATPFSSPGIVDGKFITTATDYSDERLPFTGGNGMAYYGAGFDRVSNNKLTADLMLDQKLDFITKGLSVKLKGSYNSGFVVTKDRYGWCRPGVPVPPFPHNRRHGCRPVLQGGR